MPLLMSMGFMPAATALQPSRKMAPGLVEFRLDFWVPGLGVEAVTYS